MQQAVPNIAEYTVSEISAALKRTVEDAFGYVRVRGEISGYRGPHSSGHAYFSLKDDRARLEACIWRTTLQRLRFRPEEGMEVVATGRLTTFPGSSKYQIVIDSLAPAGVGALMALLEERRKKLAAEGLFAEARKKPLPYLPRVIGVVTSPTGVVIRDILHRLTDRFPVRVIVWPVRVQGETSAAEVAAAIRGFNALAPDGRMPRPDVLIVARGGGSLEDLWSFNEEIVVRAAAASKIPLISAVGHETDWTLLDHAADRRAPTPTGAAEMAVPVRSELVGAVSDLAARHFGAVARGIEQRRREFRGAARALPSLDDLLAIPRRAFDELASRLGRGLVANAQAHRLALARSASRLSIGGLARLVERGRERLAGLSGRKGQAFARRTERLTARLSAVASHLDVSELELLVERRRERVAQLSARKVQAFGRDTERLGAQLEQLAKLLEAFSYRSILERGFALVHAGEAPIRSAAAVKVGTLLAIEFHDGSVGALAGGVPPVRRKKGTPEGQGSLF